MGLQHPEFVPQSFAAALEPNYLGSPAVVGELLARFLATSESDLHSLACGEMDKAAFEQRARVRINGAAAVFGGHDPEYTTMAGFNESSLGARLQADLGPFFAARRDRWDDNPIAVFFEWLLVKLADAWKRADGDDTLLAALLQPHVQAARQRLLGVAQRA